MYYKQTYPNFQEKSASGWKSFTSSAKQPTNTATIARIDAPKPSKRGGYYIRVYFNALIDGESRLVWTDLVPTFKNFSHWEPLLQVGKTITNFVMKSFQAIDADSKPTVYRLSENAVSSNQLSLTL